MEDYEKLGAFYLGRDHDPATGQTQAGLELLDSKQLVTHGLIIGMTGSGKTGLGIGLVEEAAIDNIPVIVIDPKGDLGNLMLTFPDLDPDQFEPWVNAEEARRKGISVKDHARQQAELWRKGLAQWGQSGERIARLRAAAEMAIYTPGSSAGRPISILKTFAAPPPEVQRDFELLGERVASTVAGLLGLLGLEADPMRSRETILLSHILQSAWAKGRDLDLGGLIQEVQTPSVSRIGVMDIETFFPSKDRFGLAMQMNNLLAAPGFAAWLEGESLDIKNLLYTPRGHPRVAIFSIAHLNDSERMFFVTLLLNELLGWMRQQTGSNSLRAMLYMDEIFGFFPPVANPPSKLPLLTLLKQARAFGLGVVLSTQNPVDLDYKGLANIGTWFIGRLQTDRDKARVMEGLEGAAAGRGSGFDRGAMERILAGLGNRIFLKHSVYQDQPELFETRWVMSYLRGPLSRLQIKSLTGDPRPVPASAPPPVPVPAPRPTSAKPAAPPETVPQAARPPDQDLSRPMLPPEIPQCFAPVRKTSSSGGSVIYLPRLLGVAQVRYKNAKAKVDTSEDVNVMTEITDDPIPVDWAAAEQLAVAVQDLEKVPTEAEYQPCAPAASKVKNYKSWSRNFARWIYAEHKLDLWKSNDFKLVSNPGEEEQDFRIRLQQTARERRDEHAEKLRKKYEPKLARLQERLRRTEGARQREAEQAKQAKFGALVSLGSTLLGAFLGRKTVSTGTVGKAATTMRGAGRAVQQAGDVKRAEENIEAIRQQITDMDAEFKEETDKLSKVYDPATEDLEQIEFSPTKSNINVRLLALVWLPYHRDATGIVTPIF